ncbi:hypothetical protein Tco_0482206 [Tanacetum coccineum]
MLNHSEAESMEMLKDVLCQVGITTVLAKFLVLDMPVDRIVPIIVGRSFLHTCRGIINILKGTTLTFDGVCHQKFYVAEIQKNLEESDIDDDEYYLKRDEMGRPSYGLNLMSYFDKNDPMEGCAKKIKEMLEIKVYEMGGQEETLSLYYYAEFNEEGFDVYFQGGLRSDEDFNAKDYWLSISSEENLHLSRSLALTIRSPILKVLQKMITYGFITRIARRIHLLTDEVLDWLSALVYYRTLDATNLRDLIDSNGKLIVEYLAPGVPRVAMPRQPRPSMQDLYDRMGNMEIHQGVIERMGAYAPPGYDEVQ